MKALENASRRDIAAGKAKDKALKQVCKECSSPMSATRRQNGYTWTCLNFDCLHTEFEEVERC